MKIITLLFFCVISLSAQTTTDFMTTKLSDSTAISLKRMEGRTFANNITIDTTSPQDLSKYTSYVLGLMTTDSTSCVIKYQLSLDGTNWTAATTIDSLRQTSAVCTTKTVTMTTTALGMKYVRFIFAFTKSNIISTITSVSTIRKYWATLKKG